MTASKFEQGRNPTLASDEAGGVHTPKVIVDGVILSSSDIEIGAVEIKDGTTNDRVHVNAAGQLSVDGSGVTQPISAAALPLPTGASTSSNQATIISNTGNSATSLSSIDTKVPALIGGRIPVVLPAGGSGLTDTELRATPVPVTGPLTDTQLRATPVPTSLAALPVGHNVIDSGTLTGITNPVAVTGAFFQATQPVSAVALPLPLNAVQETDGNLASIVKTLIVGATLDNDMLNRIAKLLEAIEFRLQELPLNIATALNQTLNISGGPLRFSNQDSLDTFSANN
jgi:hypothetical protein